MPSVRKKRACHGNFGPENFGPPDQNFAGKYGPGLLKNWSGLKTLIFGLFLQQENTANQRRVSLGNFQRTWRSLKQT